jgi:glycosyltransferase involved in cell wall biosynthesis
VVIPAFRAERTIRRAIDSVLAQTAPASEIIVVDDGSPDNQAAMVEQFERPVVLLRQANRKTAAARNTGIEHARGEFVAFLDADDYWEPHKLERQLAVFVKHPTVGVVGSRYYNQQPDGSREIDRTRKSGWYDRVRRERGPGAFLLGAMLWTGTVLVRRGLLQNDRFVSGLEPAEDRDLWIRLAARAPVYVTSQPLATAVLEAGSISRRDIAHDCTKMLEVVDRHRRMLGPLPSLLWRSYVRYRWAAMEPATGIALPLLMRSMFSWPAPFWGVPSMQPGGRMRRLAVLLKQLISSPKTGSLGRRQQQEKRETTPDTVRRAT